MKMYIYFAAVGTMTFLALTLGIPVFAIAQNQMSKIDSLEKAVSEAGEDTVKARSLCKLCGELRKKGSLEPAFINGRKGLNLAEKLQDGKGVAHCLLNLGLCYDIQGDYVCADEFLRQSLEAYQRIGDAKGAAACFHGLSRVYLNLGDFDKAAEYSHKNLKISETIGYERGIADGYSRLGVIDDYRGNYPGAIEYHKKSLEIHLRLGMMQDAAGDYNNLGAICVNQGDYARAVEFYLNSLKIRESLGIPSDVAASYNNLGVVYVNQNDLARAEDCYLKGLEIYQRIGETVGVGISYFNLASILDKKQDYEKAEEYYRKSLEIFERIGDDNYSAYAYVNLGSNLAAQNDFVGAGEYFHKSLANFEKMGQPDGIAKSWGGLAIAHLKSGRAKLGREFARKGLALASQIGNMETMRDNALTLAKTDSAVGDFRAAYEHHKLYKVYADSMRNDDLTKKIAQLESRHLFEKEIAEKKRIDEEAAAAAAERQERIYMFQSLGIFGFLVLMILSLFMLGRLNLPSWAIKGLLFVSLIMTFEFAMMLFEPLNDKYSQGLPVYKMAFNTLIALGLGPIHNLAERRLTKQLVKAAPGSDGFKRPFGEG